MILRNRILTIIMKKKTYETEGPQKIMNRQNYKTK